MTQPTTISANPFTDEHHADPYPLLAELREEASVHRIVQPSGLEVWLVTRFEDARAALLDERLAKDPRRSEEALRQAGVVIDGDQGAGVSLLTTDPPDHTRLRSLVNKAFTPRRVEALRPHIQEVTDTLLDEIAPLGEADLVASFAFPLPATVIIELLGLPVEDRHTFRAWSSGMLTPSHVEDADRIRREAKEAMIGYLTETVARKQTDVVEGVPDDGQPDLVTALIAASRDEGRLNERELVRLLEELLIGGHETTTSLIGNGMLALFRHPDELELLRTRLDLVPSAVEEFLRYDGPVARATLRVALEDVEIRGTVIPAGALVSVALCAANRDPQRFDDPDRLDICRPRNQHLGLGHGPHYCVGAGLARLEGEIAFTTLLRRFPDMRLARPAEELPWRRAGIQRSLAELPVVFTPERPRRARKR